MLPSVFLDPIQLTFFLKSFHFFILFSLVWSHSSSFSNFYCSLIARSWIFSFLCIF